MVTQVSESLRPDRDVGHIELGVVDYRSLEIVSASRRFYAWINRSPSSKLSVCDIIPGTQPELVHQSLAQGGGICEFETRFSGADKQAIVLRIRLMQTGKSEISPLRLVAFDITEMRRKEEILRTVSGYLEAHKNIIAESRKTLKALLDSLPLAVFMIGSDLKVTSETSQKSLEVFGEDVYERSILELTGLSRARFEPLELAFSGVPWNLMEATLPTEFQRVERVFSIRFVPLFEQQMLVAVTVIVDDITDQRTLERSLRQTDADNRALVAILCSKNEFFDLVTLAQRASDVADCLTDLRPLIHSLKGGFSFLECESFVRKCHSIEEELNLPPYTPELGRRLSAELLGDISAFMGRYGEILKFGDDSEKEWGRRSVQVDYEAIGDFFRQAKQEGAAHELLSAIETLAEVPVGTLLSWLDKAWSKMLIRQRKEGKPIAWLGNVRLAREPYRELFQSFVHIICNAVDHGIEEPEHRVRFGKPREGSLTVETTYVDGLYTISFTDDGAGIDEQSILSIARKRGIQYPEDISSEETFLLLSDSRFSSRSEITELSGRGLGLDAVRRAAKLFGGDIRIKSEPTTGTTVSVQFRRQRYW